MSVDDPNSGPTQAQFRGIDQGSSVHGRPAYGPPSGHTIDTVYTGTDGSSTFNDDPWQRRFESDGRPSVQSVPSHGQHVPSPSLRIGHQVEFRAQPGGQGFEYNRYVQMDQQYMQQYAQRSDQAVRPNDPTHFVQVAKQPGEALQDDSWLGLTRMQPLPHGQAGAPSPSRFGSPSPSHPPTAPRAVDQFGRPMSPTSRDGPTQRSSHRANEFGQQNRMSPALRDAQSIPHSPAPHPGAPAASSFSQMPGAPLSVDQYGRPLSPSKQHGQHALGYGGSQLSQQVSPAPGSLTFTDQFGRPLSPSENMQYAPEQGGPPPQYMSHQSRSPVAGSDRQRQSSSDGQSSLDRSMQAQQGQFRSRTEHLRNEPLLSTERELSSDGYASKGCHSSSGSSRGRKEVAFPGGQHPLRETALTPVREHSSSDVRPGRKYSASTSMYFDNRGFTADPADTHNKHYRATFETQITPTSSRSGQMGAQRDGPIQLAVKRSVEAGLDEMVRSAGVHTPQPHHISPVQHVSTTRYNRGETSPQVHIASSDDTTVKSVLEPVIRDIIKTASIPTGTLEDEEKMNVFRAKLGTLLSLVNEVNCPSQASTPRHSVSPRRQFGSPGRPGSRGSTSVQPTASLDVAGVECVSDSAIDAQAPIRIRLKPKLESPHAASSAHSAESDARNLDEIHASLDLGPLASKLSTIMIQFSISYQTSDRISPTNTEQRRELFMESLNNAMNQPAITTGSADERLRSRHSPELHRKSSRRKKLEAVTSFGLKAKRSGSGNMRGVSSAPHDLAHDVAANPIELISKASPDVMRRLDDTTMLQIADASLQSIMSDETRQRFHAIIQRQREYEIRAFVDDVIVSLYQVVRAKMKTMVEAEALRRRKGRHASKQDRSSSPSDGKKSPNLTELLDNAEQDLFDNVLPAISDCIVEMLVQEARSLESLDVDLMMMLYGSQYVDTIISNAILRTHVDVAQRAQSLEVPGRGGHQVDFNRSSTSRGLGADQSKQEGVYQGWSSVFKVKSDVGWDVRQSGSGPTSEGAFDSQSTEQTSASRRSHFTSSVNGSRSVSATNSSRNNNNNNKSQNNANRPLNRSSNNYYQSLDASVHGSEQRRPVVDVQVEVANVTSHVLRRVHARLEQTTTENLRFVPVFLMFIRIVVQRLRH